MNSIVILRPLADHLRCFQNIVESFSSNHKTFSKELQHILNNEILPKLHDICMTLQNNLHKVRSLPLFTSYLISVSILCAIANSIQDMRATKWENAENTIKVMEAISRELAGFVMEDFVQNIKVKSAEIRSKTSEVAGAFPSDAISFAFPSTFYLFFMILFYLTSSQKVSNSY